MSVRLRLMTQDDIPEAMRLKEIAGWNQTTADWQRFLSATPEGCFVAEHEGRVIGTVTTIVYEDDSHGSLSSWLIRKIEAKDSASSSSNRQFRILIRKTLLA